MSSCPSPQTIGQFANAGLSGPRYAAMEAHVETCSACQDILERLAAESSECEIHGPKRLPPPEQPPTIPGFVIERELGRGGMGVVYQALQPQLARRVAVKVVSASVGIGAEDRRRWLREARAIGRVRHRNIVQLYEVGQQDGCLYLVLDLITGGSLAKRITGPLPARVAVELMAPVAQAVDQVHKAGMLHLDIKPSNILLNGPADGPWDQVTPLLADFGIARGGDDPGATATGLIGMRGTPSFMAPEQVAGDRAEIGPRSDVYALGATLYTLLTGRPPFQAASVIETLDLVRTREPAPPKTLVPGLPRDLETIALTCLRKDPRRRYASAEALADDLERWLDGFPIRARAVGAAERTWKWARRRPALTALLGVVLLAMVGLSALSVVALDREQKAQREADKASKARDFLVRIFRIKDIQAANTTTARQILNEAEQRIPIEFANQPELRDELLAAIENVNRNLDRTIPAAMILEARGAVKLRSARGDGARPVPQTLLYPDDRLTLAADAHVQIVFMSNLHKERLESGREATIGRTGCLPPAAVRERYDSVLMTFVRLPKGTFYMGWDGTPGSAKETEIKEDFEIALHNVTQGQWEAIMGNNPSWFSRGNGGRNWVLDISDEELKLFPVENVSWDDARKFIKKLNEKEVGRGYLYRMPSEAEWEYACRAGATSEEECSYHFYFDKPTNDLSSEMANFNGNEPFGEAPPGPWLTRPTRVGAYPSNRLGLCDMHGNVWQWTDTASGSGRVDRGGSWRDNSRSCRAAERFKFPPTVQGMNLGFRLARVPVRQSGRQAQANGRAGRSPP